MTAAASQAREEDAPVVSVIMANFNGAAHLAEAIESAQRQTLHNLEILVSDDASTDRSVDIVTDKLAADSRIHLLRGPRNIGPAAARNRAIEIARGEWISVMDSDDLMHPERLETLIRLADRDNADVVADDLVEFYDDRSQAPHRLLDGNDQTESTLIDAIHYVARNHFYSSTPSLGYLKPLFRASLLVGPDARYDETLRITEDFDLVLRLLHAGRRMRIYPLPYYFYRKHGNSTSHRLNIPALEAIRKSSRRFQHQVSGSDSRLDAALQARSRSIDTALTYEHLIRAMRDRNWRSALGTAIRSPRAIYLLRLPLLHRLRQFMPHSDKAAGSSSDVIPLLPIDKRPDEMAPDAALSPDQMPSSASRVGLGLPEDIATNGDAVALTVCICTFRRHSVLRAIKSAAAQDLSNGASLKILVIDNDDTPIARKTVEDFAASLPVTIEYHHAPGRNISIARNAALEKVNTRWLVFLDDDEYAAPSWLFRLSAASGGANAVFGPCVAKYSDKTPRWIQVGDYHSNRLSETRRALTTGYTSNVLIDMDFVRQHNLRFDLSLGRTGGEDTIFFFALHAKGGILRYAQDAIVYEDVVPPRINFRWIATRRYRAGQVYAKSFHDFNRSKYRRVALTAPLKIALCISATAATLLNSSRAMWWLIRGIFHLGSLSYVLGANIYEEYSLAEGSAIHADE
ncbi:MAG TPA: glycosyltransferase [Xanthobacteraceae bacterium]|jgi:succinoglycan biosynthesis protein ExoM